MVNAAIQSDWIIRSGNESMPNKPPPPVPLPPCVAFVTCLPKIIFRKTYQILLESFQETLFLFSDTFGKLQCQF